MSGNNEINTIYQQLSESHPGRDFLVISQSISRDLHLKLTNRLREKKHENCSLFLTTFGGDPHGGYRIARCLRHHYKHIRLIIPSFCKSAGTLIAIGADELVIGDLGELGPLDIQVSNPNELQERSSGLDIMQSLQIIQQHSQDCFRKSLVELRHQARLSTKLAGAFASEIAVGSVASLYSQVDPNRLGEMQRAMRITKEYGRRLDAYTKNLKESALDQLVAGYPSHGFVIDRKEAGELFNRVSHPTDAEIYASALLNSILSTQSGFDPAFFEPEELSSHGENDEQRTSESAKAPSPATKQKQRRKNSEPTAG